MNITNKCKQFLLNQWSYDKLEIHYLSKLMTQIITDPQKIEHLLTHNTTEIVHLDDLKKKLLSGKKLRIKLGADPSRPDLHLGHSIVLNKLKEFQDLGHQIVFIIGDYTGMIGDPSGKSKTRPALSYEEVQHNAQTYLQQLGKILDIQKTELRFNSEWYKNLKFDDLLKLTSKFTIAHILERNDFNNRLQNGIDITITEILYPIIQAYDSVAINADVEIGGTDQTFNLLAGRELQKKMNLVEQNIITCPLLVGLDGKEKMSKSLNNYIGIAEDAQNMFGKIMSISDDMIIYYFKLLTNKTTAELQNIEHALNDKQQNPRDIKITLAKEIVSAYHNLQQATKAEIEFNRIFRDKQIPTELPTIKLPLQEYNIIDLLIHTKLVSSKSEARRLIQQGGVKINQVTHQDIEYNIVIQPDMIIQVGKRKFIQIINP